MLIGMDWPLIAIIVCSLPVWIAGIALIATTRHVHSSAKAGVVLALLLVPPVGIALTAWFVVEDMRARTDRIEGWLWRRHG